MSEIPINEAAIDAVQFAVQSGPTPTPEAGYVRLSRGLNGFRETASDGAERLVGGELRPVDVQLDNDTILALPTTPVELVPAPGVDQQLLVMQAVLLINAPTAVAYGNVASTAWLTITDDGGTSLTTIIVDDSGESLTQLTSFLGAATSPQTVLLTPAADVNVTWGVLPQIRSGGGNRPIQLALHNGTGGNLTGGHSDNTLSVRVWYRVVPSVPFGG